MRHSFHTRRSSDLEGLRRGDISASSFAFRIEKDEWKKEDGKFKRKILKFNELYDVSPVYRPAYSETSVQVDKRGMKEIEEREKAELAEYFEKLKSQIKHE